MLPAAKLGIVDAIVLGMGRAIGETMAVLMVVGNAPVIPEALRGPISTLTSQIALDMGYSSGLHRSALFGMGVVLFIISATLVGIVRLISKKEGGRLCSIPSTPLTVAKADLFAASASSVPFPRQEGPHQQGPVNKIVLGVFRGRGIHHHPGVRRYHRLRGH